MLAPTHTALAAVPFSDQPAASYLHRFFFYTYAVDPKDINLALKGVPFLRQGLSCSRLESPLHSSAREIVDSTPTLYHVSQL